MLGKRNKEQGVRCVNHGKVSGKINSKKKNELRGVNNMAKLKKYKVLWSKNEGAISYVEAENKKKAKELAYGGYDSDWESDSQATGIEILWNIDEIVEDK